MRIVVPIAAGFEDSEYSFLRDRLTEAGHHLVLVGAKIGERVMGREGAVTAVIETTAQQLEPDDYGALFIPGAQAPDALRLNRALVAFVRQFMATGKPVAAICYGLQLLIEADAVCGRTVTSWPSVRTDLVNAGADWVNASVVKDGNLVTSRRPDELGVFCNALLGTLASASGALSMTGHASGSPS
jgi:protease I